MSNAEDKNITRAELAEAVYHEVGLSLNESAKLLDQVLEEISKVLEKGETVKLSSFGSFCCAQQKNAYGAQSENGGRCSDFTAPYFIFSPVAYFEKTG